ncbi:MAG TPA: hypothetical protein VHB77_00925 [Planctomycetaceae bacterium]|nr:hypothetical protein [Planctomycetaceae bacterium]
MLTLRFHGAFGNCAVGPAERFQINGDRLHAMPSGLEIAHYEGGVWHYGEDVFSSIVLASPVVFRLEHEAEETTLGPFPAGRIVDGAIREGEGGGQIAKFDHDRRVWVCALREISARVVWIDPQLA